MVTVELAGAQQILFDQVSVEDAADQFTSEVQSAIA